MLGGNSRIDRIIKPSITRIKRPPKRARRDEEDLELQQAVNSETSTQRAFTTCSQAARDTLNMLELPQYRDTLYDNEGNGDSFEFTTPPPVRLADNGRKRKNMNNITLGDIAGRRVTFQLLYGLKY
jgi:hypothetical protein